MINIPHKYMEYLQWLMNPDQVIQIMGISLWVCIGGCHATVILGFTFNVKSIKKFKK
ncbi:MAG: hypothetical protein GNW80_01740 [Asgard group archaeon]|nr:hypothetical protein [Asgard group archaeon]